VNDATRREVLAAVIAACDMRPVPLDPKVAGIGRAVRELKRRGYDLTPIGSRVLTTAEVSAMLKKDAPESAALNRRGRSGRR
jgi:hypothetical protein